MNLPLYVIPSNEGVPIPDSIWTLKIPLHQISRYRTQSIGDKRQLIIGIANDPDIDALLDDIKQLSIYSHPIGLLGTVISQADTLDHRFVTLEVNHRVYIERIHAYRDENTKRNCIEVEFDEVPEEFQPAEEGAMDHIEQLSALVVDNASLFNPTLVAAVVANDCLITRMNTIADHLLEGVDRTEYVQLEHNVTRAGNVIRAATKFIHDYTGPATKPVTTPVKKRRVINPDSIKARFDNLALDEDTRNQIQRDITRLETLPKSSTEYGKVLDYLTWICDTPWGEYSNTPPMLQGLVRTLDETHHGLEDVKKHVLEHLVIEKVKGESTGAILCLTGSPGTGKTSIAKAIAAATGRPLIRISLGGVNDEATIRGHRRTYSGALPGRFITGLKKAGTLSPLFLLDEIDKLSSGTGGDPASALLEVLDREQNDEFLDRYLEVPVDLSRAMFICTANYEKQIPPALRDRLDMLYFPDYDYDDRHIITNKYLIPKAFQQLMLTTYDIKFTNDVVDELAKTKQVRTIEKQIRKLLRMAAVDIVIRGQPNISIDMDYLQKVPRPKNASHPIGFR